MTTAAPPRAAPFSFWRSSLTRRHERDARRVETESDPESAHCQPTKSAVVASTDKSRTRFL